VGRYVFEPIAIETGRFQHVSPSAHVSAWVGGLLRSQGRLERPVSCFSVARCWRNVSTSFWWTIVCLSLTART